MAENLTTVNFKADLEVSRRFSAKAKLRGLFNKDLFNNFMKKFVDSPEETLKFIGGNEPSR